MLKLMGVGVFFTNCILENWLMGEIRGCIIDLCRGDVMMIFAVYVKKSCVVSFNKIKGFLYAILFVVLFIVLVVKNRWDIKNNTDNMLKLKYIGIKI